MYQPKSNEHLFLCIGCVDPTKQMETPCNVVNFDGKKLTVQEAILQRDGIYENPNGYIYNLRYSKIHNRWEVYPKNIIIKYAIFKQW